MKKILKLMVWVMLLGLPVVMTSCDGLVTAFNDNPISPGLKVTTPSIQVEKGKTFKCNAKASSRTNLVYASADPSIATVDSYGVITGVAEGKTTITITTEGKDSQAKSIFTIESVTIPVEVIKLDVPVKSVKLDKTELAATVGDAAVTLKATVAPDNATNKTVTWKSSNTDVATVDEDGVVTFVGGGTATITATATNGTTDAADDKTATCTVTVTVAVTSVTLSKDKLAMTIGEDDETLTATVKPDDATDATVTWSSDKETVATVADGVVHAVAVGTAIITAKAGDKTATCTVTVNNLLSTPLTLKALTAGTIVVTNPQPGMQYSLNGGAKTTMTATTTIPATGSLAIGDKVAFYGDGTSITAYYFNDSNNGNDTKIAGGTAEVKAYGNIMSLIDEENFATNTTLTAERTFQNIFRGNTKLTDASELQLSATTLTPRCYYCLFAGCTNLTTAPALPATELQSNCYYYMFWGCEALTTAPAELPATTLKNLCYSYMFYDCKALTTAPVIKATTMTDTEWCCSYMFLGCTSLTTAPELKATALGEQCYVGMFSGCTSLTETPKLPAPTSALKKDCYREMFKGCTSLTKAYVKAAYTNSNNECLEMFPTTITTVGTFYSVDVTTANNWRTTFNLNNWTSAVYE